MPQKGDCHRALSVASAIEQRRCVRGLLTQDGDLVGARPRRRFPAYMALPARLMTFGARFIHLDRDDGARRVQLALPGAEEQRSRVLASPDGVSRRSDTGRGVDGARPGTDVFVPSPLNL
jgi:hypothetical protein